MAEERGRPSDFTPELAAKICTAIANGDSLRKVCLPDDMPAESTVRHWALENREGFFAQYDAACKVRAMKWADEVVDIADEKGKDTNRARLRVDTRKWLLSKVLPKVYGEKVTQVHEGGDKPVEIELTPVEMRQRMARILQGVTDAKPAAGDGAGDDPKAGS